MRRGQYEHVAIGAATDPYQPAEGKLQAHARVPRGTARRVESVLDHHTRPDDRARPRRARRGRATRRRLGDVLDPDARRGRVEAHRALDRTPAPAPEGGRGRSSRRGSTRASEWRRSCPGISDRPEQLREVVRAAREAGATGIWANLLFLRPGTREHFLEHLAEDWPEQLPLYEDSMRRRPTSAPTSAKPVRHEVSKLAPEYGIRGSARLAARTAAGARAAIAGRIAE